MEFDLPTKKRKQTIPQTDPPVKSRARPADTGFMLKRALRCRGEKRYSYVRPSSERSRQEFLLTMVTGGPGFEKKGKTKNPRQSYILLNAEE